MLGLLLLIGTIASALPAVPALAAGSPPRPGESGEYTLPPEDLFPGKTIRGPDGNLWFLMAKGQPGKARGEQKTEGFVDRITPEGALAEFPLPKPAHEYEGTPSMLAPGPEDSVWYLGYERLGRVNMAGEVTEFPVPTGEFPGGIAAGPDGDLWITKRNDSGHDAILRVTTSGQVTEFQLPHRESGPGGIAAGPDGNLWFTEYFGQRVGRITPQGAITEFPAHGSPSAIAPGSDGNLWFEGASVFGRVTPAGAVSEFRRRGRSSFYAGRAGGIWLGLGGTVVRRVGRRGLISPAGVKLPRDGTWALPSTSDGRTWFTAQGEPPCRGGGLTCLEQVISNPGKVGWLAPPSLVAEPAGLRPAEDLRSATVRLVCAEEARSGSCAGRLVLTTHLGSRRIVMARRSYSLAGDEVGRFRLRFSNSDRRLVRRHGPIRANLAVTLRGGTEKSETVILKANGGR